MAITKQVTNPSAVLPVTTYVFNRQGQQVEKVMAPSEVFAVERLTPDLHAQIATGALVLYRIAGPTPDTGS